MNTPVLFASGFRGKVASALLCVVSCVKRAHVGTADMTTFDEIIQNAYRELARKTFPIGSGFGEG